ncbi:MAG TPA: hypothetical protein VFH43_01550 [Candidatus Kapabacteria bacterium]|nr:hypothetical protein [Candidatus Kapabacteria bacterium]
MLRLILTQKISSLYEAEQHVYSIPAAGAMPSRAWTLLTNERRVGLRTKAIDIWKDYIDNDYRMVPHPAIVKGYHPNVAAPGYPVNFCWALCSLEDDTYRTLAGVNVQPGFETMPTGLR